MTDHKAPRILLKTTVKVVAYLTVALALFLGTVFLLFLIYKDDISKELLLTLNEKQSGKIAFDKISFAPFAQFPDLSLRLNNVSYSEKLRPTNEDKDEPICEFEYVYVSLDLPDLLDGNLNAKHVTVASGTVRIITYPDSSINFLNALAAKSSSDSVEVSELAATSAADAGAERFLAIDNLTIKNVLVYFDNRVIGRHFALEIDGLSAAFTHRAKQSDLEMSGHLNLVHYQYQGTTVLENVSIAFATDLLYDGTDRQLTVESTHVAIEGVQFKLAGSVGLSDGGAMDLHLSLAGVPSGLLARIMRQDLIDRNRRELSSAEFYCNATIVGETFDETPFIEMAFGASGVNLQMPDPTQAIRNLTFDGYATTGHKKDFSEARLTLEHFSAQLPGGEATGRLTLENRKRPYLDLDLHVKTDVSGFNDVFKKSPVDSLSGTVTIDVATQGEVDLEEGRIIGDRSRANLVFENVSMRFPGIISFTSINGRISRDNMDLRLDDLRVATGQTEVTLNGTIANMLVLPFRIESDIAANLQVSSPIFDLPVVFAFDPSIGRDFNHVIRDLTLEVEARSTTTGLLDFASFPAIDCSIRKLEARCDDFPDLAIIDSDIAFYDDTSGFNIRFDRLNIRAAHGQLKLTGAYNGSAWKPYSLVSNAQVADFHMLDLLNQFEMDLDSSSIFNAVVNGSFALTLEFPKDSTVFETLRLDDANLTVYELANHDTLLTERLTVDLRRVYYDLRTDSNPLASLTAVGTIGAGRFATTAVDVADLNFSVSADRGAYTIIPRSESFFRTRGDGVLHAQPWSTPPRYRATYDVKRFAIEDWLSSFREDPKVSGMMSFSVDLRTAGENWDDLRRGLNGTITNEGVDLQLRGLNIDEVLRKIERSQNFTLLDVGGVLVAGPIGLVVTKGVDVTSALVIDRGGVTRIRHLVSNWDIQNGQLVVKDVAFATDQNRVAAVGRVNLVDSTMNITIAILNEDGSARLSQNVRGRLENPELGEISVVGALLGPVTNLFGSIFGTKGDAFYRGSVEHPGKKK